MEIVIEIVIAVIKIGEVKMILDASITTITSLTKKL